MNTTKEQRAELACLIAGRIRLAVSTKTISALISDAERLEEVEDDYAADKRVLEMLRHDHPIMIERCEKFIDQVRDTCTRAEKAEAERDTLRRLLDVAVGALDGVATAENGWGYHREKAIEALSTIRAELEALK